MKASWGYVGITLCRPFKSPSNTPRLIFPHIKWAQRKLRRPFHRCLNSKLGPQQEQTSNRPLPCLIIAPADLRAVSDPPPPTQVIILLMRGPSQLISTTQTNGGEVGLLIHFAGMLLIVSISEDMADALHTAQAVLSLIRYGVAKSCYINAAHQMKSLHYD